MKAELDRNVAGANWQIRVIPPNRLSEDPCEEFVSTAIAYRQNSFVDYVRAVESYPEDHFALISIDGRARNSCIRAAVRHVVPGGVLLIDNSDREEYAIEIERLKVDGWRCKDFNGDRAH